MELKDLEDLSPEDIQYLKLALKFRRCKKELDQKRKELEETKKRFDKIKLRFKEVCIDLRGRPPKQLE